MSTNHHTAIATGAAANAATINAPLAELDAAIDAQTLGGLGDVTVTSVADNEVMAYDSSSSEWINQTASEAGLAAASHTHTASDVTDLDASEIPYTPTTSTDWDSDTDPGNVDDALDQLAERVDDLEGASSTDTAAIMFVIDGGGSAITTGQKGHLMIPFAATITEATALADQSGSIVVDIWKDTYANYPPTDADSITASAPVTISASNKSQDSTLTGWTTSISAGDILAFNVDSASTVERVTIILTVTK